MEVWKPVAGFPHYAISDHGRVKRAVPDKWHPIRVLNPWLKDNGYLCVTLRHKGKRKSARVSVLVAAAFVLNPHGLPTVNHKNGNKLDNIFTNLEWASSERQAVHAVQTGLHLSRGYGRTTNNKWQAYIVSKGIQHHLGVFDTEDGAKSARQAAEKVYHSLQEII